MALSPALLKVAKQDLGTASLLAGMIGNNEKVSNGNRWAKFQKIGPRQYKIERGEGPNQMVDEVTSPAVAKMMVIQHVAHAEGEPQKESDIKMSAVEQEKAQEAFKKNENP